MICVRGLLEKHICALCRKLAFRRVHILRAAQDWQMRPQP